MTTVPFLSGTHFDVRAFGFLNDRGRGVTSCLKIGAGVARTERVVPPAGEQHAYERTDWPHTVEIYVSPKGRSVRVYVDGEEISLGSDR